MESKSKLEVYEDAEQVALTTWIQLVRTFLKIQRRVVSAIGEQDMTLPQYDVLATLRFNEGSTQQQLAERLLVTKGNVCGVVQRLERLGWISRREDPSDARANHLFLTASGKRKIDGVLPRHDAAVIQVMSCCNRSQLLQLRELASKLGAKAD